MHPDQECKQCGQRSDTGSVCNVCRYYYDDKYGYDKYGYPDDSLAHHKETYAQVENRKYLADQRAKRVRLEAAVQKECSGCGQTTWHDPDDYLCIVCRDGRSALPDSAYMSGTQQAA